jgi:hypothetical protein
MERIASIMRVERISNLGTLAVPISSTLMMDAISFSETSVLKKATRRHIPEDAILYIHCREDLISHIALTGWAL